MLLAVGTLCLMAGCSSKVSSSKGIVSDATMNTVTIVTCLLYTSDAADEL